jgi:hypothetical protein
MITMMTMMMTIEFALEKVRGGREELVDQTAKIGATIEMTTEMMTKMIIGTMIKAGMIGEEVIVMTIVTIIGTTTSPIQ